MTARRLQICFMLIFSCRAFAQVQHTPFTIVGYIQKFTLDTPGNLVSAGKMTVNGILVVIPINTIVVMPATYLTPQDLFQGPHPTAGPGMTVLPQSGLAIGEIKPQLASYEAAIQGNIVGGVYIAGLMKIAQHSLNISSGYIQNINLTNGDVTVGPEPGSTGPLVRLKLNDPKVTGLSGGRYGRASSPEQDDRFTSDQDNPTIRSVTGYPMCVPRNAADAECPQTNRPKDSAGKFSTQFTIGTVPQTPAAPACSATGCNPKKQAPFEVGDYVTFSGTLAQDATGVFVSAHTVTAWLGIFTSPGAPEAYLNIEVSLFGTGGVAFLGVTQEAGPGKAAPGQTINTRLKVEGFTTDPSRNVDVIALDFSSTAGTKDSKRERLLLTINPASKPIPLGRFRRQIDRSNFLPPSRELRVRIVGFAPDRKPNAAVANGILTGEFTAPMGEFLFPENTTFGQPVVPMNFENLCFLARGSGPLTTLGRTTPTPVVGPLMPFPDSGHLAPAPGAPPVAGQVVCPAL